MRRLPFGGLFLAACLGIAIAEACSVPSFYWAIAFGAFAIAGLLWRQTVFAMSVTLFFFGFWHAFRKTSDQGYQLRSRADLARQMHRIDFEAEADSKPFRWGHQIKQRLFARVTRVDEQPMNFRVQAEVSGESIHYGDYCRVIGHLTPPQRALNPGEFDERSYLQHQGIYLVLDSANSHTLSIIHPGWGNPVLAIALNCRKAVEDIPIRSLENDRQIKALIEGITFGDRSEFDPNLLDLLQDTGTLHLFVIDGLKVTLLAGVSWIAARFFCLPRRWVAGLIVPLLILYCAATGLSAAGLRATLMALFVLTGLSLERPVLQLNAMSGSGFILLLYNPEELFQLGFQLSFTIVAFIVIAARPFSSLLVRPFGPDPWIPRQLISPARRFGQRIIHRAAELLAVCTICWVASLPFSIFYFHRVSFTNVVANFFAVPVGTWILFTALLSILISPLAGWASICLNNTNWLLAHLFLAIVNGSAACPGQALNVGDFPWSNETKIVLLAAGRSETLYFCHGCSNGLINPGSPAKYRRITEPFLRNEGVNNLSFLNWTKWDQDHSGSAVEAAKHFNVLSGSASTNPPVGDGPTGAANSAISPKTEKINLNGGLTCEGARASAIIGPVLDCGIGSFEVLLLNLNRQQIERQPHQRVDVVVVPSPRQSPYPELIRRFDPQAIIYLQGKPTENQPAGRSPLPIWFLSDKGAVTLTLSDKDTALELTSYLGSRLTLRSRSR